VANSQTAKWQKRQLQECVVQILLSRVTKQKPSFQLLIWGEAASRVFDSSGDGAMSRQQAGIGAITLLIRS
jgi:hypothetical protein